MKVVFAAVLMWSATACAEEAAPEAATRECVPKIRLDGTTYTGAGYTEVHGTRFDTAIEADCDDQGASPRGSEFTETSEPVAVWSLPGYSTDDVLAVRFNDDMLGVFVADSIPRGEVDRVIEDLSPPRG